MEPQILLVSDPPHATVDHAAAAVALGLDVADTRLKAGFPAPEVVWASDPARATEVAKALRDTGLSVRMIDGRALADIPWPTPASAFVFGVDRLIARLGEDEVAITYETPVTAVFCKPPPNFSPPPGGDENAEDKLQIPANGPGIAESIQWKATLDLYFTQDGELRRISIVQGVTDFSGLGDSVGSSADENMAATIRACEHRFTRLELDARLENVRPRHRFVLGAVGFDMDLRKLFSYGTLLLRQVLASISPELGELTQYEFGSRLAYVLSLTEDAEQPLTR